MASRYYMVAKAPNAVMHDLPKGGWDDGVFVSHSRPDNWHWELSASKTNGGTVDRNNTIFTNQNAISSVYQSFWTPRLTAQTVSGTLNWCWHLYRSWTGLFGPEDTGSAWVKVFAYISVGDTAEVRHILIDNHVESVEMLYTFDITSATSPASPIAITSGDASDGDRIHIEFGFYAEMPTPDPTQVPTEYMEILWLIPGATGVDLTPGMSDGFFNQRSPWLEFSVTLTEAATASPPVNDDCADAIVIPSIPYHHAGVDASQSAGAAREVWWMWTSTVEGEMLAHVFGSNYYAILAVRTDDGDSGETCPGFAVSGTEVNYADSISAHRGTSTATFVAHLGYRYWFRVFNKTSTQNITLGGGIARFGLVERATGPVQDDLYLPQGNLIQVRDGQIVNVSPISSIHAPTGIAIDYTLTPMNDLNGGTHSGERILVAFFHDALVEVFDLPTLSYTQDGVTEIDYIVLPAPTDTEYRWLPSTMHIRVDGRMYLATFGTGFEHVSAAGQPGSQPAFMNNTSDDPDNSDVLEYPVGVGSDANSPLPTPGRFSPAASISSPWAITVDEATNTLYYVEGTFYYPIGGQTVKRWNLNTDTAMADFVTLSVPAGATITPGVKGLTFIPYDGSLLVCNATQVVHVNSSGVVTGTFTPSIAMDSQALCDVKMQADGETFWVVDLWTGRLFKVDLNTMAELGTYETWQTPGTLTQMAIYQPGGITEPEQPPVPEVTVEGCPDTIIDPLPEAPFSKVLQAHKLGRVRGW